MGALPPAERRAWGPAACGAVGRLLEVKACLVGHLALWSSLGPGKVARGHSGRLDHLFVGVEDITLERQAECHMLCRLLPLRTLLLLGHLPFAGPTPLLECGCQDLLRLRAEATCKAQRESLPSATHQLAHSPSGWAPGLAHPHTPLG